MSSRPITKSQNLINTQKSGFYSFTILDWNISLKLRKLLLLESNLLLNVEASLFLQPSYPVDQLQQRFTTCWCCLFSFYANTTKLFLFIIIKMPRRISCSDLMFHNFLCSFAKLTYWTWTFITSFESQFQKNGIL